MTFLYLFISILGLLALATLLRHYLKNRAYLQSQTPKLEQLEVRKWNPDFLESKRKIADIEADSVITQILENGEENAVNNVFTHLTRNQQAIPETLPQEVQDYFKNVGLIPAWADKSLILAGEKVFIKYGPEIVFLLLFKALPECYACAKGAKVLAQTNRLGEKADDFQTYTRRIGETAQFVVDVMSPGGLSPNGRGEVSTQKVRLIHASIRYYLRKYHWDSEKYGEPINQEDMAGTLSAFSGLILEGLSQIGITLSEEEKESYAYCWKVAGTMIGLNADLIPNNAADNIALGHSILTNQMAHSEDGVMLTKALVGFIKHLMPIQVLDDLVTDILRFVMGDEIADILEIPPYHSNLAEIIGEDIAKVMGEIQNWENKTFVFQTIIPVFNRLMLKGSLSYFNKNKNNPFYIPPSLQKDWNIEND